jgi:hypothetical protein
VNRRSHSPEYARYGRRVHQWLYGGVGQVDEFFDVTHDSVPQGTRSMNGPEVFARPIS